MTAFALDQVDGLLTTTKAVRRRLDLSRPVDREVVAECVALASYAPNRSNHQSWRWLVVDDPALRAEIGEEYRRVTVPAVTPLRDAKLAEGDDAGVRISESVLYLAEKMSQVPVLVIPCIQRSPTSRLADQAAMFGSIYPAVWSFQLALRSRGLGSVLTTAHLLDDRRIGKLLGIASTHIQTCLIPVAHTTGDEFKPSTRNPADSIIGWNCW
jgi:nitroreductase